MIVCHITPHKIKGHINSLLNVQNIYLNGLRPHSSVCIPETIEFFKHHAFRNNRKNQWGCIIELGAILYFDCDERYLQSGCDGDGPFYNKQLIHPIKWELIER